MGRRTRLLCPVLCRLIVVVWMSAPFHLPSFDAPTRALVVFHCGPSAPNTSPTSAILSFAYICTPTRAHLWRSDTHEPDTHEPQKDTAVCGRDESIHAVRRAQGSSTCPCWTAGQNSAGDRPSTFSSPDSCQAETVSGLLSPDSCQEAPDETARR